jgi:hypothetical protein
MKALKELLLEENQRPEVALNKKVKSFKELVDMLAAYFGVRAPMIRMEHNIEWKFNNYKITRCYLDAEYVKFKLSDPATGEHELEIIRPTIAKIEYPVFNLTTRFIDGKVKVNSFRQAYQDGEKEGKMRLYRFGKDKFYDWCPKELKQWFEFNQQ